VAHLRRGFTRGRSPRRQTGWEVGPGGSTAESFSISSAQILGAGLTANVDGLTIVRIRGSLQAYLLSVDAAGAGFHFGMGIGVVSADAFGVGVSAVPDPIADADWDGWMYHRFFDLHSFSATISQNFGPSGLAAIQFEVDTKAMRKIGTNDVLMAVLESVEAGSATANVHFDSRVLFKLS